MSTDGRLSARRPAVAAAGRSGPPAGSHALAELGLPDHLLLVPEAAGPGAPLVVWFHGAGGHAERSVPTVRAATSHAGALVLLPSSSGATWDLLTGRTGADVGPLDTALRHVLETCDVGRVAFAGFSDGASYALSLGLANGGLAEAVLAFSPGFVSPPALVGRPRCWVAHGTADTVLPVDRCGRRVVALLERQGYPVHYEEFDGPHVVRPDDVVEALRWWLDG